MPEPRFEVPTGDIDGVNTTFYTAVPYQAGSIAYFCNGVLLRRPDDDGWTETDPSTGRVDLSEAPLVGDTVQFFYLDTAPPLPSEEITAILGTIVAVVEVAGTILDADTVEGRVLDAAISATIEPDLMLDGRIVEIQRIVGTIACGV